MSFWNKLFGKNEIVWDSNCPYARTYYKASETENVKNLLTAKNLIGEFLKMTCSEDKCVVIANQWVDSSDVHIRENNNQDNTIDELLDKQPEAKLDVKRDEPIFQLASEYIESQIPSEEVMMARQQKIQNRVADSLNRLFVSHINSLGGVIEIQRILSSVFDQNTAFLLEMYSERTALEEVQLPDAESELQNYCSLLGDKSSLYNDDRCLDKVNKAAFKLAQVRREILRRTYAVSFFRWLDTQLELKMATAKKMELRLNFILQEYNCRLAMLEEIDENKKSALVVAKHIDMRSFFEQLPSSSLLSLFDVTVMEAADLIIKIVSKE